MDKDGAALDAPSPAEIKRILMERASHLSAPVQEAPTEGVILDVLAFSVGEERYAVETQYVLEAVPLRGLTPVPCTPSFVLGVINHRGHILPVLHLGRFLGRFLDAPGPEIPEAGRVIAAEAGGMTFGLFADSVEGTLQLAERDLGLPPGSRAAEQPTFLQGVTHDMIAVLDLEALTRDPRILVDAEE
jgi:purine-binding chemotaxis protein CheW